MYYLSCRYINVLCNKNRWLESYPIWIRSSDLSISQSCPLKHLRNTLDKKSRNRRVLRYWASGDQRFLPPRQGGVLLPNPSWLESSWLFCYAYIFFSPSYSVLVYSLHCEVGHVIFYKYRWRYLRQCLLIGAHSWENVVEVCWELSMGRWIMDRTEEWFLIAVVF